MVLALGLGLDCRLMSTVWGAARTHWIHRREVPHYDYEEEFAAVQPMVAEQECFLTPSMCLMASKFPDCCQLDACWHQISMSLSQPQMLLWVPS